MVLLWMNEWEAWPAAGRMRWLASSWPGRGWEPSRVSLPIRFPGRIEALQGDAQPKASRNLKRMPEVRLTPGRARGAP
jgi:hypothetical protein